MVRLSLLAPLLLSLVVPSSVTSAQSTQEVEANGVRLPYVEQGSGEPIVFVHGAISDRRAWEPVGQEIARTHRYIAYTQRYFGTGTWMDRGEKFSVVTHAEDLAAFVKSINAGPVHLVGWSYGGQVAAAAAVKSPELVRSLILYEASVLSVLPPDSAEGKAAREERGKLRAPIAAANKAGDPVKATRLLLEAVFQLPTGGSEREPQALQTMWDENARTTPLLLAAPPPPEITCDMLRAFTRPTLIMEGEKTAKSYVLINDALIRCIPGARRMVLKNVNHDGPVRDPAGFSAAVTGFLSQR
jgi:pimeloyl-ACP methyl ester carboxylesterase